MTNESVPTEAPPATEPKKHSLTARLLAAVAFSTVGAKISWGGLAFDAKDVCKDMTWGEKFKGAFNGKLWNKIINEELPTIMAKENLSQPRAIAKLLKYTIITTAVGTVAGGVLGWMRGGEIENWKDIIHHPIRSTKLVLGLEKKPEPKKPEDPKGDTQEMVVAETKTEKEIDGKERPAPKKTWASGMQKTSHVDNALKPDAGISGARI